MLLSGQIRAEPSLEAVSTCCPSAVNTASLTTSPSSRLASIEPELTDHTRAVRSSDAVTIRRASGLNAAE